MLWHRQSTIDTVTAVLRDPPLMFFAGAVVLIAGLALVLAHNVWSGGVASLLVTVIGWLTLIKGWLFVFLPSAALARFYLSALQYDRLFYLYAGFSLALGAVLIYYGFRPDITRSMLAGDRST